MHVAVVIAMVVAHCFTAVAPDHARPASLRSGGEHLIALRAPASPHVFAPRFKGGHERVQVGHSPFDCSPGLIASAPTRSADIHTTPRVTVGLLPDAPGACRPPPSPSQV